VNESWLTAPPSRICGHTNTSTSQASKTHPQRRCLGQILLLGEASSMVCVLASCQGPFHSRHPCTLPLVGTALQEDIIATMTQSRTSEFWTSLRDEHGAAGPASWEMAFINPSQSCLASPLPRWRPQCIGLLDPTSLGDCWSKRQYETYVLRRIDGSSRRA